MPNIENKTKTNEQVWNLHEESTYELIESLKQKGYILE
jgi:hypothetical protein